MYLLLRLWNDLLDLFYPNTCCACTTPLVGNEACLCTSCRLTLPRSHSHTIYTPELTNKFAGKVAVSFVYTFLKFEKGGKVQRLLHQLKYKNRPEVGQVVGRLYGDELRAGDVQKRIDLLVPVPLHPRKKAQRGYNQSDMFAEGLSETLGVPWSAEVLARAQFTSTQTRKTRLERFENVSGIFEVVSPAEVVGKRIAIVDDVVTTGSTLESAVATLLESGAKEVSVITMAAAY
ncbi:MAG: ComF family protein [Bacteroidetes bacterium]|nr:ComF family protein [Bacteroidota bacterium]